MKTKVLMCGIAACFAFVASADDHLERLHKDTLIMENIMTTSLKQNSRRDGIRFRKIETGYLAGQGLVFDVYTSSKGNMHFNFDFGEMIHGIEQITDSFDVVEINGDSSVMVLPDAPEPPGGFSFSFDFDEDAEDLAEHAREMAREALRENKHRWRDLREKEKELEWERREYERTVRDYEFEMRHSDDERKEEIEKQVKELRDELAKLDTRREEYAKQAKELEEKEQARKSKEQESRLRQVKRFLADFEATIAETLCNYGSGLKSLPDSEKVNFVLKDFSRGEGSRSKEKLDKVYVFSLKDVRQCVLQDMSPNDLLMNTKTYLF